jgi:aspartokinase/homoserine dehydrogenase 1
MLESGVSIVTPNKIANTLESPYYEELHRLSRGRNVRYFYETTVGAATPMIRALQDLRRTGDMVGRIEGVFSGTLSYVFSAVNRGEVFSHAVREAVKRGLTEPHPALDLSGEDVARKLLILAREAGYRLERDDIQVEGLVPVELRGIADPHAYVDRLSEYDETWSDLAARAHSRRARLAYLARFDGSSAVVGIAEVSADSPFVLLRAGENAVHYYSDRHSAQPLTIQGSGGGPEVTARGVLADVIQTAHEVSAVDALHD